MCVLSAVKLLAYNWGMIPLVDDANGFEIEIGKVSI
jgi:hypothetical protein